MEPRPFVDPYHYINEILAGRACAPPSGKASDASDFWMSSSWLNSNEILNPDLFYYNGIIAPWRPFGSARAFGRRRRWSSADVAEATR